MKQSLVYLVLFSLSWSPGSVITTSGQVQMIDIVVLERGENELLQCSLIEERERARYEIHQITNSAVLTAPIHSCNGVPGWRRVAFINMTDTRYNCPTGLTLTSYSKRTCGRYHTLGGGCSSTTFSVRDLPYSRVCGRIMAYQFGATTAYEYYTRGININYVAGVSLTHGAPGRRQHIWTFAAGISEVNNAAYHIAKCPCDISRNYDRVPAFVGNDYFCESGLHSAFVFPGEHFYPNDVLWDGQNCISTSTCCQFNNPPWFTKNLPTATTDDIELRICTTLESIYEDTPIELIELYVQ